MPHTTKIAVYCTDETERSVISFVLSARMVVTVLEFDNADEVIECVDQNTCRSGHYDLRCVVVIHSGRGQAAISKTQWLLNRLRNRHRDMPVLLIDLPKVLGGSAAATEVLAGVHSPVVVIDSIRRVWSRTRGPKPQREVKAPVNRVDRMVELADRLRA